MSVSEGLDIDVLIYYYRGLIIFFYYFFLNVYNIYYIMLLN